jgi:hypothetical protein
MLCLFIISSLFLPHPVFVVEVWKSRSWEVYMIGAMKLHGASLGENLSLSVLMLAKPSYAKHGMTLQLGEHHVVKA